MKKHFIYKLGLLYERLKNRTFLIPRPKQRNAGRAQRNKWSCILAEFLCIALIISGGPVFASQKVLISPTPTPKPTSTPSNKTTVDNKVSGKKVKKPPYVITINDTKKEDHTDPIWNIGIMHTLNVIGKREEGTIPGQWQFFVTFTSTYAGETKNIAGTVGGLQMGIEVKLQGMAKGELIDLVAKKKKEDKENKEKGIKPTPTPKQTPVHTDPNTAKNTKVAPTEAYSADLEAELSGAAKNTGEYSVAGTIENESGNQWITAKANIIPEGEMQQKAKIKLMVDSNDNVTAEVTVSGKKIGPFVGRFTSEEELQVKRKDSYKWPIWGVWTDVNPYEPMPNLQKDAATVADQLKKKEEVKKINYPVGRWVALKLGKGDDPSTYKTIQVSVDDVTFETGEIWPYPGSAMFVPDELKVYSKDLKKVLKTEKPYEYEQIIKYNTIVDTIDYPDFGRLVRVRSTNLLGVWSSVGLLGMPDVKKDTAIKPGTWYEFTRATDEDAKKTQKGYSAAYSFTRLTVKADKSVTIDKGSAFIMPVQDDEMVILSGIKTENISPDGKSTKSDSKAATLSISDYDKDGGSVKISLKEFTLIPGVKLSGAWSTEKPPIGPPDVEGGAFYSKTSSGEVVKPSKNAQWMEFDSDKKTFVWTQILDSPDGILVREGKYRTIGGNLLLLTNIKGSFYARPGTSGDSFKDQDYMYNEKLFQITLTKTGDTPVSLSIGGVGSFKPVE